MCVSVCIRHHIGEKGERKTMAVGVQDRSIFVGNERERGRGRERERERERERR